MTLWISDGAVETWSPAPSGKRGGQRKFSDHTILSRRAQHLDVELYRVASNSSSGITAKGGPNRLQHYESNRCARPAKLFSDRQRMKIARERRADAAWPIHAPTPPTDCKQRIT